METAYAAAGRSSKQPSTEGQGRGACKITEKFKSPSKSFPKLRMETLLCTEPPAEEAWRAQLNPKHAPLPQMPLRTLWGLLSPRRGSPTLLPSPPSRWESIPWAGWSKPCPCTQRTRQRGCSRLPALPGGWHMGTAHFAPLSSFSEAAQLLPI